MTTRATHASQIHVLLAEDNPADVRLTEEGFKESKLNIQLSVVADGVKALAYLRRTASYADAPRPDLILLDLKMPRKSGHAVLMELKSDDQLKDIPVIILTTSDRDDDVRDAYRSHANSYIVKPIDFEQFRNVVRQIEEFWFRIASLPPN
jgi:two-component system response regulator